MSGRVSSSSIASLAVTLLVVAGFLGSAVDSAITRPAVLKWVFLANVDVGYGEINLAKSALDQWVGMKAAEKYINDNDLLDGTKLNITLIPGLLMSSTSAAALVPKLLTSGAFGYIMPDWLNTDVAVAIANMQGGLPIVSPDTTSKNYYTAATKNVLFLRQPFVHEHVGLLNYAVNGQPLCSFTAVIAIEHPGIIDIINAINATMMSLNQPPIIAIQLTNNQSFDPAQLVPALRNFLFQKSPMVPGCIVFLSLAIHIVGAWMDTIWSDPRLDRANTYFFAPSSAILMSYNSTIFGTAPYEKLRITQTVTKPNDATIPSVAAYQTAFEAWRQLHEPLPEGLNNLPAQFGDLAYVAGRYTYSALSGYYAGMFVYEVLKTMTNITSAGFINTVYNRKFVNVHEVMFGPFSSSCLTASSTAFPCFCNTGGRSYYMTQVNTTTGVMMPAIEDPISLDGSQLSISTDLQTCVMPAAQILQPLTIGMLFFRDKVVTDHQNASLQLLLTSMIVGAQYANVHGNMQAVGRFNPLVKTYPSSALDIDALLFNVTVRSNPVLLLGGHVPTASSGIPSLFHNAVDIAVEDPELTAATAYSHYSLQMIPVLADYIHALVQYATNSDGLAVTAPTAFMVAFDTARLRDLLVLSFHTFQVNPSSLDDLSTSGDDDVTSVVSRAIARAQALTRTVIVLAAKNNTVVSVFLAKLAAAAASDLTSVAMQESLTVLIACDPKAMHLAKLHLAANALAIPSPLLVAFGSVVAEWWVPGTPMYIYASTTMGTTDAAKLEDPVVVTAIQAGSLIFNVMRNMITGVTRETLIAALYGSGTLASMGANYGPFYANNCSAQVVASKSVDRTCQCAKGPRSFYVLSLNDWVAASSGRTNGYFYTMKTCGVAYAPLATSSSLNYAMIGGAAGAGGSVFLGSFFILGFFAFKGKRDNRAAPKDSDKPFAMMFTDIQSSTSLWARAPQQMGPCVDRHHAEIRKLCDKYDGYEVKTIGDSFMIAFNDPKKAVALALGIQKVFYELEWPPEIDETYRGLAREAAEQAEEEGKPASSTAQSYFNDDAIYRSTWNGLRVRVGLHFGVGSVKLDPVSQGYDYYGTLVNTAARVEGVGNGGQVLVTKDMYDELERLGYDFGSVDVTPLGPQPLRGLDAPVPLYQLNPAHLKARSFNALRLDIENPGDEEESNQEENNSDGSMSMVSDANATAEQITEKFIRSKKLPQRLAETIVEKAHFLEVAFSTSPSSWRGETTSYLLKKWRANARRKLAHESEDHYEMVKRLTLAWRLALAQEEVKKSHGGGLGKPRESMRMLSLPTSPNTQAISQFPAARSAVTPRKADEQQAEAAPQQ